MSHECQKEDVLAMIREELREIKQDVKTLLKSTAMLTVKASIWGVGGGAIVVLMWYLRTKGI